KVLAYTILLYALFGRASSRYTYFSFYSPPSLVDVTEADVAAFYLSLVGVVLFIGRLPEWDRCAAEMCDPG
ncbi:unnamed protein product, partial [Amoebophrya sp. A120]